MGTPQGCVKTNTIKRVPAEDARAPMLFNSIKGQPWKWNPQGGSEEQKEDDAERPVRIGVKAAAVPVSELPEPVEPKASLPRRVYIRKDVELDRYGFTDNCKGCEMAAVGGTGVAHSLECRKRVEAEMEKDELFGGAERVEEAKRQ